MPELSRISIGHFESVNGLDVPVLNFFAALYFHVMTHEFMLQYGLQFNYLDN